MVLKCKDHSTSFFFGENGTNIQYASKAKMLDYPYLQSDPQTGQVIVGITTALSQVSARYHVVFQDQWSSVE